MALKIEMLRTFCTVAQTGNLADAADRLGRTQAAVSMMLTQFETHLGKKLFEGERKNTLSPLGEEVYELALRSVRHFGDTVESIESLATASQGLLRIASVPSIAARVFPAILEQMTLQFPYAKFECRDSDSRQVIDALAGDKADIGIASGHHAINGVESVPLLSDRFGLVASHNHPLMMRKETPTIAEVVNAAFVNNALCDLIESPLFASAIEKTHVTIHNTNSLIAIAKTGKWVTVLPRSVVSYAPLEIGFREIAGLPEQRRVYLYWRRKPLYAELSKACCSLIRSLDFSNEEQ